MRSERLQTEKQTNVFLSVDVFFDWRQSWTVWKRNECDWKRRRDVQGVLRGSQTKCGRFHETISRVHVIAGSGRVWGCTFTKFFGTLKWAPARCTAVGLFEALRDCSMHSNQHSLRASNVRAPMLRAFFTEAGIPDCVLAEPARPSRNCRLDRMYSDGNWTVLWLWSRGRKLSGVFTVFGRKLSGVFTVFGRKLRDVYTVFGRKLSDVYTVFGRKLGDVYTVFGRKLGDVYTVFGRKLSDVYTVFGRKLGDVCTVFGQTFDFSVGGLQEMRVMRRGIWVPIG
jgi:hypothetical protein